VLPDEHVTYLIIIEGKVQKNNFCFQKVTRRVPQAHFALGPIRLGFPAPDFMQDHGFQEILLEFWTGVDYVYRAE